MTSDSAGVNWGGHASTLASYDFDDCWEMSFEVIAHTSMFSYMMPGKMQSRNDQRPYGSSSKASCTGSPMLAWVLTVCCEARPSFASCAAEGHANAPLEVAVTVKRCKLQACCYAMLRYEE